MKNVTDRNIKDIFLQAGFKEKPQADGAYNLNPYVFEAARALLEFAAAPVPPAGDVEVRAHIIRTLLGKSILGYGPSLSGENLVSIDHVTRLTAERDGLLAKLAMAEDAATKGTEARQVAGGMQMTIDDLQSELTKARELLKSGSSPNYAHCGAVMAFLERGSPQ